MDGDKPWVPISVTMLILGGMILAIRHSSAVDIDSIDRLLGSSSGKLDSAMICNHRTIGSVCHISEVMQIQPVSTKLSAGVLYPGALQLPRFPSPQLEDAGEP